MKVYTKSGDRGSTSLIGGKRVSKAALQVEAYGSIDELKSHIALLGDLFEDKDVKEVLEQIIIKLFEAESLVASAGAEAAGKMPQLKEEDVEFLERNIDKMDEVLPGLKAFVLPGGSALNSHCNIARAVCRRAERATIRFDEDSPKPYVKPVVKYLNRLSDYLFTLSRYSLFLEGKKEILWLPKGK